MLQIDIVDAGEGFAIVEQLVSAAYLRKTETGAVVRAARR